MRGVGYGNAFALLLSVFAAVSAMDAAQACVQRFR